MIYPLKAKFGQL